ncbi:MAG: hypothetical protein AAGH70_13880 [Pseudomonadota bacterium]
MIRGMTKLKLGPAASTACRVPLLTALLILGAGLAKADPKPLTVEEFTEEVVGLDLYVETAPIPTTAVMYEDGSAKVQSAFGTWRGEWAGQGMTFCLVFESGPLTGYTCAEVSRMAAGQYSTSRGTRLRTLAGAERL